MEKKRKRMMIIIVLIICIIVGGGIVFYNMLFGSFRIRRNDDFSREINRSITRTIRQYLAVYYGEFNSEKLANIVSDDLLEQINEESRFRRLREERGLFGVYSDTLQSMQNTGEDDSGNQFFFAWIRVYEGWEFSTRIHQLAVTVQPDGTSIITFIDYDR